jgi:type II secretion system protein N
MKKLPPGTIGFLARHLAFTLIAMLIFAVVLFPFGDLGDLVTVQVSKNTQNRVFVQFDDMSLSVFPSPGVDLNSVHLEVQGLPPLSIQNLNVTPSLGMLISQKPAGSATAQGLLGGNVKVSAGSGKKSESGNSRERLRLHAEKISLENLKELAHLPVNLKGRLNIDSEAQYMLSMQEQPEVELTLSIDNFELPPSTVNLEMGPVTLPDLKLQNVELKGRLVGGKLNIEEGKIGKEGDEVRGTLKGGMGLSLQSQGGQFFPVPGAYSFDIDLNVKNSFQSRAKLFLMLLDSYKTPSPDGSRYALKVSSMNPMQPPQFSALSK